MPVDQPRAADNPFEEPDQIDKAALAVVLRVVPLGTAVLAGSAVALLVLGYLAIYLLVFLPRGVNGGGSPWQCRAASMPWCACSGAGFLVARSSSLAS
jgi:hypothetical protein